MLKFVLYWLAFNTLGRLPLSVLYALMGAVAWVAYQLVPGARRNVLDNLQHVMPDASDKEARQAAKEVFRNIALYYADTAHMPRMDLKRFFEQRFAFRGLDEHLRPAIAEGRGAIILGGHVGNPELAIQALAHLGIHVFALTEPVHPRVSKLMDSFRASQGLTFAPVSVGSVKRVFKSLQGGGVVALLGDRDIEGPKETMEFFGEATLMPSGPIELGLRTGAIVLPCFCVRKGKYGIEAWVEKPLKLERTGDLNSDVRAAMSEFIERLEACLRANPGQWAVLERVWDSEEKASGQQSEVRGQLSDDGGEVSEVAAGERGDGQG